MIFYGNDKKSKLKTEILTDSNRIYLSIKCETQILKAPDTCGCMQSASSKASSYKAPADTDVTKSK